MNNSIEVRARFRKHLYAQTRGFCFRSGLDMAMMREPSGAPREWEGPLHTVYTHTGGDKGMVVGSRKYGWCGAEWGDVRGYVDQRMQGACRVRDFTPIMHGRRCQFGVRAGARACACAVPKGTAFPAHLDTTVSYSKL